MQISFKRRVLLSIIPPIAYLFMWFLYLSCKKRYHVPKNMIKKPYIVAFWHENILMSPFLYKKIFKNAKISIIISNHFDGELIAKSVSFFGFEAIRGSSSKGGIKALKESFRKINLGHSIAITPDGPRGPRHSVADGIVAIAQKKGLKIMAFNYKISSYWRLNSWDQFIIPKPFSSIDFYASEPFSLQDKTKEEAKELIKQRLWRYV